MTTDTLPQKLLNKFQPLENGCWKWNGAHDSHGYGMVRWNGKGRGAHRVFYEELVGIIPDDLQIDHLCRNRECVNPSHMEVVSQRENILRGNAPSAIHAKKTHCPQGHTYDTENTYMYLGRRLCRACHRIRERDRRHS